MDVSCIGEMLIDFICPDAGKSIEEAERFSKKAGGATANVAAAVAKLGGQSAFVGKVGDDSFGRYLKQEVAAIGVDVGNTVLDTRYKTSLAFVSLKENGERDFEFFREPGADVMLEYGELDVARILASKLVHFGSISLIGGPMRETTLRLLVEARKAGCHISYDPNLRPALWSSTEHALAGLREGLAYADIVKVSEEELSFIADLEDEAAGVRYLHDAGVKIVFVTKGSQGALVSNGAHIMHCDGLPVKAVDTTGAGDGFTGAYLYRFAQVDDLQACLDPVFLSETLGFANQVGAITTTQYGAISALPTQEDVRVFMENKTGM